MQVLPQIDYKYLSLLSPAQAHKFRVIPLKVNEGKVLLLGETDRHPDLPILKLLLGKQVQIHALDSIELEKLLLQHYPNPGSKKNSIKDPKINSESDTVRFVNKVLEEAASMQASDIHIERYELLARIRFRWEGQLIEKFEVPLDQYNAIISRIKILAELDISERRLPQDGRIHLKLAQKAIDIRVSTLPGKYGEKAVLRLLTRSEEHLDLNNLSFTQSERNHYQTAIQKPNGIILITGPTGSGKTTTLYATLNQLNQPDKNILTIEDPIEYNLSGINQVQLKEEIGLSFDRTLRAFLRQDPDIIMVGEIRDQATAQIAIRAALTGHLVFSTLHTNSSADAITRLTDMGVEPYLLAASIRLVLAQRLVRSLCPHCKESSKEILSAEFQKHYGIIEHKTPVGCKHCHFTGFKGRQAVFEVLPIEGASATIIKSAQADLGAHMQKMGIPTLQDNLAGLVREGITSISEAMMH
ncbi:MAG: GspE/PulE family protein [Bacteroidota bacterium]